MSSCDMLLKCRTNDYRYSSAGMGGLCVAFLALCRGRFVSGLYALQCLENSVEQIRLSRKVCQLLRCMIIFMCNAHLFIIKPPARFKIPGQ